MYSFLDCSSGTMRVGSFRGANHPRCVGTLSLFFRNLRGGQAAVNQIDDTTECPPGDASSMGVYKPNKSPQMGANYSFLKIER